MTTVTTRRPTTAAQQAAILHDLHQSVYAQLANIRNVYGQVVGGIPPRGLAVPDFPDCWRVNRKGQLVWRSRPAWSSQRASRLYRDDLVLSVEKLAIEAELRKLIIALSHLTRPDIVAFNTADRER